MGEKFESDFSGGQGPDGLTFYDERSAQRAFEEREFDLRVKMFALDMAVQALPTLVSSIDTEESKLITLRLAAAEFEKILRGETAS
jgi:hypothetical protein